MLAAVFFSYSHADEGLRDQLEKQLAVLKRQSVIETWHDRRIGAGAEGDSAISGHVEHDDIILLLVSHDFLASNYCYDREMLRAMERHEAGEAIDRRRSGFQRQTPNQRGSHHESLTDVSEGVDPRKPAPAPRRSWKRPASADRG